VKGKERERGGEGRGERRETEDGRKTDEIFLTGVKLLSISIQPKLLFAAHLNKKEPKRSYEHEQRCIPKGGGRGEGPNLSNLLAVQIVSRLCERLQSKRCTDHDEKEWNPKQRGVFLQPPMEWRVVQWP
jgi:hypothetical protein